jgi:hypothetical protein
MSLDPSGTNKADIISLLLGCYVVFGDAYNDRYMTRKAIEEYKNGKLLFEEFEFY